MIEYIVGTILGLCCGILIGWILSLPKDDEKIVNDKEKDSIERKEFNERTSTAYFDEEEWNECIKDSSCYTYDETLESSPKKKKKTKKK